MPILAAFVPIVGFSNGVAPKAPSGKSGDLMAMTSAAVASRASFEQRVLRLVNEARQSAGLHPFRSNSQLSAAAQALADDLATTGEFSHEDSRGRRVSDRVEAQGYRWRMAAENIAKGQRSPEQVVDSWMHSPMHRQNIMMPTLKDLGFGLAQSDGQLIWVQVFGDAR